MPKIRDVPKAPRKAAKPAPAPPPMVLTPIQPNTVFVPRPEPAPAPVAAPVAAPQPAPEPTLLDRLRARWPEAELEDLAAGKMRLVRMSF